MQKRAVPYGTALLQLYGALDVQGGVIALVDRLGDGTGADAVSDPAHKGSGIAEGLHIGGAFSPLWYYMGLKYPERRGNPGKPPG